MTKQTINAIKKVMTINRIARQLKSALVWALMLALVWNSTVIQAADTSSRNRRTSKPAKKAAPSAAAVQGQTMVVWGPQQVVRQPINTTYYASFSLPSGAIPPYQMTVSNGAPNGTQKVSQACIKLNGVNVLSPTCYHSVNPTPQIRTVSLQANNNVEVSLIGPSLSYITITVTANQASLAVSPTSGTQGQTMVVNLTGTGTNWVAGQTTATFGGELTVDWVNITSATAATAQITISATAALGPRNVTLTTGSEVVTAVDGFTVNAVTPPGAVSSTVSTLAGSAGNPGFADGTGSAARFRQLAGIAAAPNEVVYVADAGNHAIRSIDVNGAVTTVAGTGSPGFFDAQGTSAEFNNPQGVAFDPITSSIYVADSGNHTIRRIDSSGNVTTLAGDGTSGFTNGQGASARFNNPKGIAVDNSGNVLVADTGNHVVRKIDAGGNVTTLAGDGTAGATDGSPARFNGLAGVAVDGQTVYVYLADTGNHRIRRLDGNGITITLAGADRGFKDGTASQSRFADPTGIAVDGAGHIIVAETTNSLVREVDPALALGGLPSAVYTLAGTGERGSTDGAGNAAKFNKPAGVAVLASSAVIVADTGNNTLRKILLPPVIASLTPSQGSVGATVTIAGNRFDGRGASFNTVKFAATGGGTVNATVTSATRSELIVTVPVGTVTGNVTVQTAAGTSNGVAFTLSGGQAPVIADFNPKSGPIGTLVTITGTNLMAGSTTPTVTFAGAGSSRLPGQVAFASATEVRATVPAGAVTGVIELITTAGTATTSLPFTIAPSQDFTLTLAPSTMTVVQGSTATFEVMATSPQTNFTQLISLTAPGLASGAVATFNPSQITAGGKSTLTIKLSPVISPTSYNFTVQGVAKVDGSDLTKATSGSFTVMASGSTTLAGRVLSTDAVAIPGCTVSAPSPGGSNVTATTDGAGNFLLIGLQAGPARPIFIQPPSGSVYPAIKEPADVGANQSNVVPYTFYLPAIDHADEQPITLNSQGVVQSAVTVINQRVPGISMTIPQGIRLINLNGQPVAGSTLVSITPVPIDRTPAPLPSTLGTTLVYTSQPGSICVAKEISSGVYQCDPNGQKIPVIYPNLGGGDPGTRVPLWAFDHENVNWYQYGMGTVSNDGRLIVPDPGVGLRDFSWHFPALEGGPEFGIDCLNAFILPVNLSSGAKHEFANDISFGGSRGGIILNRIYSHDLAGQGSIQAFGRWTHNFDFRLSGAFMAANGEAGRLRLPGQARGLLFSLDRTEADGTRVFKTTAAPGQLGDELRRLTNGTFEYRNARNNRLFFNATGRITSVVTATGNTTTLTYTGNNLTRITDSVGRYITLFYDANNRVQTVTDPLGRVTAYSYNGDGFLLNVTDPQNNAVSYAYTGGRLSSITDPRGSLMKQITYYGLGDGLNNDRVKSQKLADGGELHFSYTYAGRSVTGARVIDQLGRIMEWRFDGLGFTSELYDGLGLVTRIDRNLGNGTVKSVSGSCGCAELTLQYNGLGMITSGTDRLGQAWQMEYHPTLNRVSRSVDELGRETLFTYDASGNVISIRNALFQTTNFTYDTFGQLTSVTDQLGHSQQAEYDVYGNVTAVIDALGNRTTIAYDLIGRMTSVTDPLGRQVSFTYDNVDRLLTVTDAAGATTTITYDANGNRTKVKDHLNREWTATYDVMNRPVTMTDPLGRVARLEYNRAGEVTKVTSPTGRVVRYEYDARGQMVKMVDPLSGEVRYSYDARKNLVAITDQRGKTTAYTYDILNRQTSKRDPLGRQIKLTYDAADNVRTVTDKMGRQTTINYDVLDRPTNITMADATVTVSYDAAGRPTGVTDTQGGNITWTYDNADRVLSETTPAGTVSYAYNIASQIASMTAADRAPVNYGYDSAGRLNTITQSGQTFTFNYDILSRRSSLQRPNGVTTSYSYDQADRLSRLTHANGIGTLEDFQYEYNSDDEITKITSLASATLAAQSKTVSAADAANRIAQIGAASFSFDQEGQITSKTDSTGITNYQWDARGRLKQAALPNGQTVGYGYDALGRRSSRTANGVTTNFLYDGTDVAVDRENGVSKVEYLNGAGVDEKLRQTDIGIASYYFLQDHLGSTSALTNSSGALISQSQYEAFGASTGSSLTRYGYTGRELDSLTGLMHYRARWYDPQQGRFMSEDPIGFDGGLNLYGYVGNSPMMYTDPSGQIAFLPILAAAGASFVVGFTLSTLFGQCYGWKDVLTDWAIDAATFGAFKGVKWLAKAMGRAPKAKHLLKAMSPQLMKGIKPLGGRFGQAINDLPSTYRGQAGVRNAEQKIMDAFENGISPRGGQGAEQSLDNLVTSINNGSKNSGWVQSTESWKVAEGFATNAGQRGGVVFEVTPRTDSVFVNRSPIVNQIDYIEQEIVAHPGGIKPSQILRAHILDRYGNILRTYINPFF